MIDTWPPKLELYFTQESAVDTYSVDFDKYFNSILCSHWIIYALLFTVIENSYRGICSGFVGCVLLEEKDIAESF